jgi:pyruvate/2-oxoacid:ferredoxin oxidoreductase alpha subunit/NAD-dependent dihydropyrimidine dehydrogenase PreA subunit
MSELRKRPQPFIFPEYCKGCGRCIDACPKHCIEMGQQINPATGLVPIELHLDQCNGCGLCMSACPEPYGLQPQTGEMGFELQDPAHLFGQRDKGAPTPEPIPDQVFELPEVEPLVIKGTYASAIGALLAGCRHFYGYPITPSTEGAELMARVLPKLDGVFLQAVSEVATANIMFGCGGAGRRAMTFTSSPGFSLMLEGISYMIGAELPGVFVDIMRGGPGLGNIAPEQSDIKLACRGLGHGNTRAIVLAPATPQEMLDLTKLAFDLSFKYRNPVVLLGDGYLGQMTGKVVLPRTATKPGIPEWAVFGDRAHRGNLVCSIALAEADLEIHNKKLIEKYDRMAAAEQRADLYRCADADTLLIACNTPSQMAKGAIRDLRDQGVAAGLFRPITLWPFPIDELKPLLGQVRRLVVVEASNGQLEDELRLALSRAGVHQPPEIEHVRRYGGVLPQQQEIVQSVLAKQEVLS